MRARTWIAVEGRLLVMGKVGMSGVGYIHGREGGGELRWEGGQVFVAVRQRPASNGPPS